MRNAWLGENSQSLKVEDINLTFLVLGTPSGECFYRRRKKKKKSSQSPMYNLLQVSFPWNISTHLSTLNTTLIGLLVLLLPLKLGKE